MKLLLVRAVRWKRQRGANFSCIEGAKECGTCVIMMRKAQLAVTCDPQSLRVALTGGECFADSAYASRTVTVPAETSPEISCYQHPIEYVQLRVENSLTPSLSSNAMPV